MKTLIIAAHPRVDSSHANKAWLEALSRQGERYTVHELYRG